MITLHVEDIQCSHCTMRIEKALTNAKIKAEISLENKTVKVDEENKNTAMEILDDLGFPAKVV